MRTLISESARCAATTSTAAASIIQSRHRIPEIDLRPDQVLVLQVPHPEPLRRVVPDDLAALQCHAERDYTPGLVGSYDDQARLGGARTGARPSRAGRRRPVMSPSPIPRFDVLRLDRRPHPILMGAGRRARLTALPPYTSVQPLAFEDVDLEPETAADRCHRCGSTTSYRVPTDGPAGALVWCCSDVDACAERAEGV
jgi:alpha-D-ribose 1-methylphosphonate 5-phosphate C-P lyase